MNKVVRNLVVGSILAGVSIKAFSIIKRKKANTDYDVDVLEDVKYPNKEETQSSIHDRKYIFLADVKVKEKNADLEKNKAM